MNNGWIKLHRAVTDHEIFYDDKAFKLFMWLLTNVDRSTGSITFGRFTLAREIKMNPNTLKDVIKRLDKKYKIITTNNTKRHSQITLLNWAKYQSVSTDAPQVDTTRDHQQDTTSDTIPNTTYTRIENKELRIEKEEKIPNRLNLIKSQKMAFLKEYPGVTQEELEYEISECNRYMNMSSSNYTNPGLFFKGWMKKHCKEKRDKEVLRNDHVKQFESLPKISEEQRVENLQRVAELKKSLLNKI